MPPKREASGSNPGPSTPAKVAKPYKRLDIMEVVTCLRNNPDKGVIDDACDQLQRLAMERSKDTLKWGFERNAATKQITELQEKNAALERELKDTKKGWDEYMDENKSLIRSLRQDAARARDESQHKTARLDAAQRMALDLDMEFHALQGAAKNLQSAELGEDDMIAAVDVGRVNPSGPLPSYLLDRDVAQKIVDHYTHRVDESIKALRYGLAFGGQESTDIDDDEA